MKHITLLVAAVLSLPLSAQVLDGSFEAGPGTGPWTEASSNFGTPLCNAAGCGTCGGPCVPRTGSWYAWFGGAGSGSVMPEVGSVEQSIFIPSGTTAQLRMYVKIALAGTNLTDRIEVSIDGTVLETIDLNDASTYTAYTQVALDINSFANGANHTIKIEGTQEDAATVSNILVDDVDLTVDGNVISSLFEHPDELGGVKVYPNPASDNITVSFGSVRGEAVVVIRDIRGNVVESNRWSDVYMRTFTYDARVLANGAYTVTVEQGGNRVTHRLVVAH
ncbi:MAG: T9SS type A sorting domain-containing protein [Flavobacteriales bacterium]|nr:T9SS type A sorting domain-containing protein [Flavobacteriales bacterium]